MGKGSDNYEAEVLIQIAKYAIIVLAFVGEVNATAQWCLPHPLTGNESQKAESHKNLQIHTVNIYERRSRLLFDFQFIAYHSGQNRVRFQGIGLLGYFNVC